MPVEDLLPHAAPMRCIDRLLSASVASAEAEVLLSAGHILLHEGLVTEAGYVEMAAQTAGAMKGYAEKVLGLPVKEGFLAAVQDFSVDETAQEGETLRITVHVLAEISGVSLIEAHIFRVADAQAGEEQTTTLASGKLKVFVPEQIPAGGMHT